MGEEGSAGLLEPGGDTAQARGVTVVGERRRLGQAAHEVAVETAGDGGQRRSAPVVGAERERHRTDLEGDGVVATVGRRGGRLTEEAPALGGLPGGDRRGGRGGDDEGPEPRHRGREVAAEHGLGGAGPDRRHRRARGPRGAPPSGGRRPPSDRGRAGA